MMQNNNGKILCSFEPITDKSCTILLLGTMPGPESLRLQQYYGYKQNSFWRILYSLFDEVLPEVYEERVDFLLRHHIAAWDVLKNCERESASDSDIRNPVPNDFAALFDKNPGIRHIFFNGGNSEKLFGRHVKPLINAENFTFHRLPSTSPANAIPFQEKLDKWEAILQYLQE